MVVSGERKRRLFFGSFLEVCVMAGKAKAKGKTTRKQVEDIAFVRAVQTSATLDEVAEKTGLKKGSIQTRCSTYRKKGIPLKLFPKGGGKSMDVEGLASLAKELAG
jgi:transposase